MHGEPDTSWQRILENLKRLEHAASAVDPAKMGVFQARLKRHYGELLSLYLDLYGNRADCMWYFEQFIETLVSCFSARREELLERDVKGEYERRADTPGRPWYQRRETIGAMCYADRFAGTIAGIHDRLDYLEALGIKYLHIMPPFACPPGRNDGGYAVSSYRAVRPELGKIEDIDELAAAMHERDMRLVLDFVFNHTSDEHEWALAAKDGDPRFLEHYFVFPDRRMPDKYDATLREIFPEGKRGSFVYNEALGGWVWSTFNEYQWDLNYSNPQVFEDMVDEMLTLLNRGVDVLRLDALAFTWKELGTACENLPRVHTLIRLFHVAAAVVAPSAEFKSEAIVHPDDVLKYVEEDECRLSYNPLFMALSWESMATRRSELLTKSLEYRYALPSSCAWINYVRSHDDIGWTFSDEDARQLGIDPGAHRAFLNRFYTGRFPGSFAAGVAFQLNPTTGDCRICGTGASLAGIERALRTGDAEALELAVRRFLMLHAIAIFARGIPVIYLGDEYGQLNDYSYAQNPETADDSRWVHRPFFDPDDGGILMTEELRARVRSGIEQLIHFRRTEPEFDSDNTRFTSLENPHILVMKRDLGASCMNVIYNLSEDDQSIDTRVLLDDGRYSELDVLVEPGAEGTVHNPREPVSIRPLGFELIRSAYRPRSR